MAQRDKRIRAYGDEKELLEEVRDLRYDRPDDVPLGKVIGDLAKDEIIRLNGGDSNGE